jgi:hypothetical protein
MSSYGSGANWISSCGESHDDRPERSAAARGSAPSCRAPAASIASEDVRLTAGPSEDVRVAFSGFAIDGMAPRDIVMRAMVAVGRALPRYGR